MPSLDIDAPCCNPQCRNRHHEMPSQGVQGFGGQGRQFLATIQFVSRYFPDLRSCKRQMRLPDEDLDRLLRDGESFRVEMKRSLDGDARNAIGEAICSFANDLSGASEPGVIFVGVQDQQLTPSGFVPDEAALQTLMATKTDGRMSPPPSMLVERRTVAGMQLAVVTVEPSPSPRFVSAVASMSGRYLVAASRRRRMREF